MRVGICSAIVASSLLAAGAASASVTGPVISTVAGGDGGPGLADTLSMFACGLSAGGGQVTVSGLGVVWQIKSTTGWVNPIAGTGISDSKTASGAPALQSTLPQSCASATDASGNVLLADAGTNLVRVVAMTTGSFYGTAMTKGDIYTIAGTGTAGSAGSGGPALKAELDKPSGVAVDTAGNIVITEGGGRTIQVVATGSGTYYGRKMTAGDIYTVFTGDATSLLRQTAVDPAGNLIMTDNGDGAVFVLAEKSGTFYGKAMTAGVRYPVTTGYDILLGAITLDHSGNIVFADSLNAFNIKVVAGSTGRFYGQAMTAGQLYTIASAPGDVNGVAADEYGNMVFGGHDGVYVLAAATARYYGRSMTEGQTYLIGGAPSVTAGDGGPATSIRLDRPVGTWTDPSGNTLIADEGYGIRLLAASTGTFYGLNVMRGHIYTISRTPADQNYELESVSMDRAGNILVGDDGGISVIAEHTGTFYNQHMTAGQRYAVAGGYDAVTDSYGNLVSADARGGIIQVLAARTGTFYGVHMIAWQSYVIAGQGSSLGNGGPARDALLDPTSIRIDAAGNLVIADYSHSEIRVLAKSAGTFYGRAMRADYIYDVAGSPAGAYGFSGNGGPAVKAELHVPRAAVFDGSGNLLIADTGNNQIRVVAGRTGIYYGRAMTAGDIYTIAGSTVAGFWGDGGPAMQAALDAPASISVLASGAVIVTGDNRVRSIG